MSVSAILVVLDSEKNNDILVSRARRLALAYGATLELYVPCFNSALEGSYWFDKKGLEEAHSGYVSGKQGWLAEVSGGLIDQGIEVRGHVEWAKPQYKSILERSELVGADLILKQADHHSVISNALFTHTDWHLIRDSRLPLLFVNQKEWGSHLSVAAAVDPLHQYSKSECLDEAILLMAHELACNLPAELHVIHAYEPVPIGVITEFDAIIPNYEDYREQVRLRHRNALDELLMRYVEPSTMVHFEEGVPERVLPHVVTESDIDLVVMGAVSRSGLDKIFIGNTAERVMDRLDSDILVLR